MSGEQKAMVDFIIVTDPNAMTEMERLRFAMMTAAYAGVAYKEVSIVAVAPTKSSLIRIEMPRDAAERVILGFQAEDPRLASFLDGFALAAPVGDFRENPASRFGPEGGLKLIETARPTPADRPPVTNVKEEGLESLIVAAMTGFGWVAGTNADYDREYAVDLKQLIAFLEATQEEVAAELELRTDSPVRRKFLAQLQSEITRRGPSTCAQGREARQASRGFVLRHALAGEHEGGGAARAEPLQRHPAACATAARDKRALDLCAVHQRSAGRDLRAEEQPDQADGRRTPMEQYKRDRDPRETLFAFGRCVVHFAVDDHEVAMCTELKGQGHGQGFVVSAVQPGLERRRGQSAEPGRHEDGLPLEAHPHAGAA